MDLERLKAVMIYLSTLSSPTNALGAGARGQLLRCMQGGSDPASCRAEQRVGERNDGIMHAIANARQRVGERNDGSMHAIATSWISLVLVIISTRIQPESWQGFLFPM